MGMAKMWATKAGKFLVMVLFVMIGIFVIKMIAKKVNFAPLTTLTESV